MHIPGVDGGMSPHGPPHICMHTYACICMCLVWMVGCRQGPQCRRRRRASPLGDRAFKQVDQWLQPTRRGHLVLIATIVPREYGEGPRCLRTNLVGDAWDQERNEHVSVTSM